MRYYGITKVFIPWFDTDGMKQRSALTFTDTSGKGVDIRRIWREIRKFAQRNFNKRVPKIWIRSHGIINTYDPRRILNNTFASRVDIEIEAWIKRMEHNEAEDGADTASEAVDAQRTTGEPVCSLPNTAT